MSTVQTLPAGFNVKNFGATVVDPVGGAPTTVIRAQDPFRVDVHWETDGALSQFLPGAWHVDISMESIGPGPELRLGHVVVPLTPGAGTINYNASVNVPANTVNPAAPDTTIPMKLVTTISFVWATGIPGPMAGYDEGPILMFYRA